MHQFLQLKHGLRLTPISTKAVYISNVSYLKKYGNILGFTGTLGGKAEKEELNELYTVKENGTVTHEFKCYTLPSSHPKQFYEEPTVLANSEQNFFIQIFNALKIQMDKGRSVLVIADSVKSVEILNREIKRIANEKKLSGEELKVFSNAIMYKRDYEKFKYADGTTLLPPQMIIFSTNLAGRGTDIKISKKLEENGGLHVIVAFLPQNIRIEEQAYGRAGRSGESGTAQMIIYEKTETDIVQLKRKRNEKEKIRIQKIKEHYLSQIAPEEECFAQFSKLAKEFRKELQQIDLPKEYQDILCKDIFDQYALELDANIKKISEWNIQNFCNDLKAKYVNNNMRPLQPSNILKYAAKMVYF
uniref:Preprotein translocase subunit SecA n=1 Tax=Panagrolaimus sp. PS1159 TaxID=55785 RepID=A0AC35GGE4_9BILA